MSNQLICYPYMLYRNMKRTIFISAGHSNKLGRDRGAASGPWVEGVLTAELRGIIIENLKAFDVPVISDSDNSVLQETLNQFRGLMSSNAIAVDLHFNSSILPRAEGTEVLIPEQPSDFELLLAQKLAGVISDTMEIKARGSYRGFAGVKTELESHHRRLAWMRLKAETVLLEICFISNPNEIVKYQALKEQLGRKIAEVLALASSNMLVSNAPMKNHIVLAGQNLYRIASLYDVSIESIRRANHLNKDTLRVGQRLIIPLK